MEMLKKNELNIKKNGGERRREREGDGRCLKPLLETMAGIEGGREG